MRQYSLRLSTTRGCSAAGQLETLYCEIKKLLQSRIIVSREVALRVLLRTIEICTRDHSTELLLFLISGTKASVIDYQSKETELLRLTDIVGEWEGKLRDVQAVPSDSRQEARGAGRGSCW